jgi:hypothetical protein
MDSECLFFLLVGTAALVGLELWAKVRLGAVVCSLDAEDEDRRKVATFFLLLTVGVMLFTPLCLGSPRRWEAQFLICGWLIVLGLFGVYPLLKARQGGGAKLGEGGIQEPFGPKVYRWRDIGFYEWAGRDGCDLILHVPSDEYSPIRFQVPPRHKATVDGYLMSRVLWKR